MRKIAYIKKAVPNAEGKKIKRIMLYSTSDDEVYVFASDSAFDLVGTGCDNWFDSLESAEEYCRSAYNVDKSGWIYISDPMADCQHDTINPIRVRGRDLGNPQFGKFEFFDGQDWCDFEPTDKISLKNMIEVQVIFDTKANKDAPFGFTYRPYFVVTGMAEYLGIQFYDLPNAPLGSKIQVRAKLLYDKIDYSPLKKGVHFVIREGGKTVGEGTVLRGYEMPEKKVDLSIAEFEKSLRLIDGMLIETGGNERIVFEIIASEISKANNYDGSQDNIIKTIEQVYGEYDVLENKNWKYLDKMLFILSEIKEGILSNKVIFYHLKKVRDCEMGKACWFYLTDSYYYLQFGKESIYEYTNNAVKKDKLKSHFLDYQFSRFLEDIFDVLIETIQPIPKEIYQYFDTDEKYDKLLKSLTDLYYCKKKSKSHLDPLKEKEQIYDLLGANFLWRGSLDSSFISGSVLCRFVHVEDMLYIHYDCTKHKNAWTAGKGVFEMPYKNFIAQVEVMIEDFFLHMDKQVAEAIATLSEDEYSYNDFPEAYKKKFPEQFLEPRKTGAEQLQEEHSKRRTFFYEVLNKVKSGKSDIVLDWNDVKEKITLVLEKIEIIPID